MSPGPPRWFAQALLQSCGRLEPSDLRARVQRRLWTPVDAHRLSLITQRFEVGQFGVMATLQAMPLLPVIEELAVAPGHEPAADAASAAAAVIWPLPLPSDVVRGVS